MIRSFAYRHAGIFACLPNSGAIRFILGALGAVALLALAPAHAQTVRTQSGEVAGVTADGLTVWKGIPYAAPPTGELRWRPPQPIAWSGVRQATAFGPACPQPERGDGGGVGAPPRQDEDCLTLNVFAPAGARNLPVMVWIHGGAFRLGFGSSPVYDGASFARQGIILVTLNYRLGFLGFFAHPALTREAGPGGLLGNFGLMDQIAALQWVQDNISAFGGDPGKVTAFGESAGGSSMIYLLANPKSRGLFSRAIVQSGGGLQRPADLAATEKRGVEAAARIGLGTDAAPEEMRAKPATDWIRAQGALQGGLGFGPFIDGRLVTEAPWQAFSDGRAQDVPLLIGANSNEASVLATLGVNEGALQAAVGPRLSELRKLYPADISDEEFTRQAMGDVVFVAPSRWIAAAAARGQPSYLYYFSYVASARRSALPGANHGSEIPYVFRSWSGMPVLARGLSGEDKAFSDVISACWVTFAKTGKPGCAPAPDWPAYDARSDLQMSFGPETKVESPPRAAALDLLVAGFPLPR